MFIAIRRHPARALLLSACTVAALAAAAAYVAREPAPPAPPAALRVPPLVATADQCLAFLDAWARAPRGELRVSRGSTICWSVLFLDELTVQPSGEASLTWRGRRRDLRLTPTELAELHALARLSCADTSTLADDQTRVSVSWTAGPLVDLRQSSARRGVHAFVERLLPPE